MSMLVYQPQDVDSKGCFHDNMADAVREAETCGMMKVTSYLLIDGSYNFPKVVWINERNAIKHIINMVLELYPGGWIESVKRTAICTEVRMVDGTKYEFTYNHCDYVVWQCRPVISEENDEVILDYMYERKWTMFADGSWQER